MEILKRRGGEGENLIENISLFKIKRGQVKRGMGGPE